VLSSFSLSSSSPSHCFSRTLSISRNLHLSTVSLTLSAGAAFCKIRARGLSLPRWSLATPTGRPFHSAGPINTASVGSFELENSLSLPPTGVLAAVSNVKVAPTHGVALSRKPPELRPKAGQKNCAAILRSASTRVLEFPLCLSLSLSPRSLSNLRA